jgi:hypothetical protein
MGQDVCGKKRINRTRMTNADGADGRGLSRIKPEETGVNSLYPHHQRSMKQYTL